MGCLVEVCRRRCLKVNENKSRVMVLDGIGKCVIIDETRLEQMTEFKYLGFVLDESGTDVAE